MTYVLVPGAGGDGHYWHRLAPLLGPDTVPVTLPAADESAGLAAYADTIVAAAGDATGITLVAQSMGGFSAPLAVERLDVRRLVLLNAMVPRPGETFNEWWGTVGVPEQPDWDEGRIFFHDVPAEVTEDLYSRGEPQQADKPCGEPFPLEAWPDVPTSAITGRDDRLFPESLQRAYLRDRLGIEPTVVPGGHLVALSNPEGLAAALQNG
ncbi:alpha/beta hydrolase [Nocardioides anomalus]|uniref:Alpha/beta hydrolase n=1 Tax=Nocardioides anomalus TaxID=2712223 RepID=A0A6G6WEX8_9ACTN|nr:alpha/beta hydrolase [Nocardioides anomalus]QIG43713.1 alpha/beta hydrolase [Nocardioides anomalus]